MHARARLRCGMQTSLHSRTSGETAPLKPLFLRPWLCRRFRGTVLDPPSRERLQEVVRASLVGTEAGDAPRRAADDAAQTQHPAACSVPHACGDAKTSRRRH